MAYLCGVITFRITGFLDFVPLLIFERVQEDVGDMYCVGFCCAVTEVRSDMPQH
jgi:hypothetical protein